MDYEYVWVPKLVLEQATLFFEMEHFFNLKTILPDNCNFEQVVISRNFIS